MTFGDVLLLLVVLYVLLVAWRRDDTDGKERSGMMLYTDHKTGLQYLGNPLGGITPRLDADGKHMRAEEGP